MTGDRAPRFPGLGVPLAPEQILVKQRIFCHDFVMFFCFCWWRGRGGGVTYIIIMLICNTDFVNI